MLKRLSNYVGILIGVLGVAFVVRQLVRERGAVAAALGGVTPEKLFLALVVGVASMTMIGVGWRRCLSLLDAHLAPLDALRRYFVGQLGKYVPGGIWPVVGRAEMARRGGVTGTAAYGSTLLSLGLTYLGAALVAAAGLIAGAGELDRRWLPALGVLPIGIVVLHPRVLGFLLRLLRRITRRDLEVPVPAWRSSVLLLLLHVPAWLGIAFATWLVAETIDPGSADFANIAFATSLAWFVGFVAIGVPGGIGVREAVFVGAATSLAGAGVAAAVAVTARVVFILVDLGGAAATSLWSISRLRSRPSAPPRG